MTEPTKQIYVASSWRNDYQPMVVTMLRTAGFFVYDFKDPEHAEGFRWTEVSDKPPTSWTTADYLEALEHPRAEEGFNCDFDAMKWADTFVLVNPCGRSAHLEMGWAVGQGKRTAILLEGDNLPGCKEVPPVMLDEPELMYKMCDFVAPNMFELLGWLGVED